MGHPVHEIAKLHQAFELHAMARCAEALRAREVWLQPDPVAPGVVEQWERETARTLPRAFRLFVTQISAGYIRDDMDTRTWFSWPPSSLKEMFSEMVGDAQWFAEELELQLEDLREEHAQGVDVDPAERERLQQTLEFARLGDAGPVRLLGLALQEFAAHGASRDSIDASSLMPRHAQVTSDHVHAAEATLVVESYFEGNHGEYLCLLVTQGPLTGEIVRYDMPGHRPPAGGDISHWGDAITWLREFFVQ